MSDSSFRGLLAVVVNGSDERAVLTIDNLIDVNQRDDVERTLLHYAAYIGRQIVVEALLKKGVIVDTQDRHGETALHNAARAGFDGVVDLLLNHGAEVDKKSQNGVTALQLALSESRARVIFLLVARGADVNTHNEHNTTALHYCVTHDKREMLEFLIAKGTNVNKQDADGWTPLHYAASLSRPNLAEILVKSGASVHTVTKRGRTALHNAHTAGGRPDVEIDAVIDILTPPTRDVIVLPYVLNVAIALAAMHLPPYVILEIVDWLTVGSGCCMECVFLVADVSRFKKVRILESVQRVQRELSQKRARYE